MSCALSRRFLPVLGALLVCVAAAGGAAAQSAQGEPTDLFFRVHNATDGQPATLERVVISYVMVMPEVVIDTRPEGSAFELEDVPVKPDGRYIVTAWAGGVPYYFPRKGRQLVDGEQLLNVFSTGTDLADVTITGMNVVCKREGDLLRMEYLFQVANEKRPQLTVFDPRATFRLFLPDGARQVAAEFHRGPTPTAIPVSGAGGDAWELGVPLVSGNNRLRLTAVLPWREGLELPMGAELPVTAWSLLVTPENIEVDARQMEPDADARGLKRLVGPSLEGGESMLVRLTTGEGPGGPVQNIFGDTAETTLVADTAASAEESGSGLSLPLLLAAAVVIIIVAGAMIRRRG